MIYYNLNTINDWNFGASGINMVYKNGIAFYRRIVNKPAIPKKFQATYSGGETYSENCDDDSILTSATTKPSGYEYSAMTSAVIGQCVTAIGGSAFSSCWSLTSIDIPSGVTSIGNNAFSSCWSLTSIDIPSGVTTIGGNTFESCSSLTSITIPDSVTTIGGLAFYGCTSLTSCTIGSGVTSIDFMTFASCKSLTSIVIPNSVTSIGVSAFYRCSGLTSCTIGSGVTSIGDNAFSGCTSLQEVHLQGTTPPTIASNAFANCPNLKHIYIPNCQYADAYAATDGLKGGLYEYIYAEDSTHCEVTPPTHDYSQDYFTVVSESAGTSVQISGSTTAMTFQVSTNGGTSWGTAGRVRNVTSLSKGAKVLIRSSKILSPSTNVGIGKISITGACSVEGNVMSLMYGSSFKGKTTMQGTYCFYALFNGCGAKLLSVENLVLPATTLKNYCYGQMFYGCTKIEKAPILPATTLKNYCYQQMFLGCSSLSYIKAMFTTTPSAYYTNNWVANVKSSGTFVKNSSATWDVRGNYGVPNGWTIQRESS